MMTERRSLIVAGSRTGVPRGAVWDALSEWVRANGWPAEVITGGCPTSKETKQPPGAPKQPKTYSVDDVAGWWAVNNELAWREFRADWDKHGKAAGPIRNSEMAKAGTHLLCVHTGSRGSLDMKRKALAAGLMVTEYVIGPPEEWPSDWVEAER